MKNSLKFLFFASAFLLAEVVWADTVTKTVMVSFDIEPVTVLKTNSRMGASAVRLGPVSPRGKVSPQAIDISIVTNERQRYQIYHRLEGDLMNAAGTEFPPSKVLFKATSGIKGGASEIPDFREVPKEETLLFTSKPEGGPDQFQIFYSVDSHDVFPAGLYYGNIHLDLRSD